MIAELPPMQVAARADRLRSAMAAAEVEALLVTDLANVRYLTGFTGSAGVLLVTSSDLLFVTDGRYAEQSAQQLAAAGVHADIAVERTQADQDAAIAKGFAASDATALGLEAGAVTWAEQRRYAKAMPVDLLPTEGLVEGLRAIKDEGEVARLEAASGIADAALAEVAPTLAQGATESEVALALDTAMRRLGAEGPSFETIVASGPNGAKPHHRPGRRAITEGDLVVIDFGALVDGYHSDMTRTFMVGDPTPTQARMLEVVAEAQAAGVAAVRAGTQASDVDAACRDHIAAAGWGDAFLHGTGHGVGLVIHEAPRVAQTSTATLAAGQVVTVEPGVYLPEHGGVRIEDTVVVTEGGCRTITLAPKDPTPGPA